MTTPHDIGARTAAGTLDPGLLPAPDLQTEWWYYAGWLHSGSRDFGFHFSYFRRRAHRSRIAGWFPLSLIERDVRFAHLSVTDPSEGIYRYAQRRAPALGTVDAGESGPDLKLWLGSWCVEADAARHRIRSAMDAVALDLSLEPVKPLIRHGTGGQVHKGASAASTHLSLPRMRASGSLNIDGQAFRVAGEGWMDREFGTFGLATDFGGWRWLALQLDNGTELMLYRLVNENGNSNGVGGATWVDASGRAVHLERGAVTNDPVAWWQSSATGIKYASAWIVRVAELGLDLRVSSLIESSEIDARPSAGMIYWESPVHVEGHDSEGRTGGHGFAEQVVPPPRRLFGLYDFGRENLGLGGWLRNEVLLPRARRGTRISAPQRTSPSASEPETG